MTRDDISRFRALEIDASAIGLERAEGDAPYFCTPADAEYVASLGSGGVHFVLLPGNERVFCVDPGMGEEGTYVLPVGRDFRTFLSYVLFCRDANPLSQISWMDESRFRALLKEDLEARWPGCEAYFARKEEALSAVSQAFGRSPADPFKPVKALQSAFEPSILRFSEEYYNVLGLESP